MSGTLIATALPSLCYAQESGTLLDVKILGQEVFLDIYKSLSRFDPDMGPPFSAWLYISARNRCISELWKQGRGECVPLKDYHSITGAGDCAEAGLIRQEGDRRWLPHLNNFRNRSGQQWSEACKGRH